jgi:hypothetical protein
MKLMHESAHEIVENDPTFRVPRSRGRDFQNAAGHSRAAVHSCSLVIEMRLDNVPRRFGLRLSGGSFSG